MAQYGSVDGGGGGAPTGGAGGALSGQYPNPGLNVAAVEELVVESDAVREALGRVFVGKGEARTRFAIDRLTARHADNYMDLVTYDGSGQVVHPDVVDLGEKWNGYRYWMAGTPYPNGNDVYENPCIWASNDGVTWVVPAGLTNPIFDPVSGFAPDPCLHFENGTLYCLYSGNQWQSTTDGVTWSARQLATVPGLNLHVSPTFMKTDGVYRLWEVDTAPGSNTLQLWTSTAGPVGPFGAPTTCTVTGIPAGRDLWHIAVRPVNGGYIGTFTLTDIGTASDGTLHLAFSEDGVTWDIGPAILSPEPGTPWSDSVYRGCFLPTDGRGGVVGRLWYSGLGASGWRLGYTEVYAAAADSLPELAWAAKPNLGLASQVIRGSGRNRLVNPSLLRADGIAPAGWNNNLVGATGHGWDVARQAWTFVHNADPGFERNVGQDVTGVVAGQAYAFSVDGETETVGVGEFDVGIIWRDSQGATISVGRNAVMRASVGRFARASYVGVAPAGAVSVGLLLLFRSVTGAAQRFWVRRAQFEQGAAATEWTPSAGLTVVAAADQVGPAIEVLGPLTASGQVVEYAISTTGVVTS